MSYGGYQDQGNPYGNPYTSAPNAETGYGRGQEQHELQTYQPGQYESYGQQQYNAPATSGRYGDFSAPAPVPEPAPTASNGETNRFFQRRSDAYKQIQALDQKIADITGAQNAVLSDMDQTRAQQYLDSLVGDFRLTLTHIGDELRELKALSRSEPELKHVAALRDSFKEKTTRWQQLDAQYRQRSAAQIGRQARIVNPDVTDDEIRSIMENGNEEGVFQQALLRQDKANQARAVLGNVQARHNEIKRIEESIMELANLFQDLDTLVVQQESVIVNAEHQTEQTNENIGKGTEEVDKGIVHARRARRNKWICLGIVVLIILIAIAIGVAVGLTQKAAK